MESIPMNNKFRLAPFESGIPKSYDKFEVYFNRFIKKNKRIVKISIFLIPLIFVVLFTMLKWKSPYWYRNLVWKEDSVVEYLTAIFYFLSCMISFSLSVGFYKNKFKLYSLPYFILTVFFFLIAMEEISWGQRILNLKTPEYILEYNYQKELNFHNLEFFPLHLAYIIVGLYGGLTRFFIPRATIKTYKPIVNYFTPNYYLTFYFLIVAILYLYYDYFSSYIVLIFGDQFGWGKGYFIHGKDQEPAEFILSIGFLMFLLINKYRQIWNANTIYWIVQRPPQAILKYKYNIFYKNILRKKTYLHTEDSICKWPTTTSGSW